METITLNDFIIKCNNRTISQSEMYNYIKLYTNYFDKTSFDYLRSDLNKYVDNIKFTLILERTDDDGAVEQTDYHTTVKNYIEKQQEFLSLVLTPRQKIDFVLNDIKDKKLNYYNDESIFTLEFNGFLRFYDMVEKEYKKIVVIPEPTLEIKPFDGLLLELSSEQLDKLFEFLTTENKAFSKPTFIDVETTDRQSFDYIFGRKEKPTQFIPIEWQANNQWLREILAGLQIEKTYHKDSNTLQLSNEVERQASDYFTKKGEAINIKSTKQLKEKPEYKAISKILATI